MCAAICAEWISLLDLPPAASQDQQAFTAEVEDEDGLVSEVTDALLLDAAASNQSPLLPGSMTASQPSATKGATHRSIHRCA